MCRRVATFMPRRFHTHSLPPRQFAGKSGECWKEGKKRGLLPDGTEYNVPPEMAQRGPAKLQQLADYFTPQVPPPAPRSPKESDIHVDVSMYRYTSKDIWIYNYG